MNNGVLKCCFGCTKRYAQCHATCEEYARQKAENDRVREERYKGVSVMYGYRREKDDKIKRKMKMHKR